MKRCKALLSYAPKKERDIVENSPKKRISVFSAIPCILLTLALCYVFGSMFLDMYGKGDTYSSCTDATAVNITYPEDIIYESAAICPNSADLEALDLLPGVGPTTAQAFHNELALNGPFFYPEDILAVKGIGEKKLENIRPLIRLP